MGEPSGYLWEGSSRQRKKLTWGSGAVSSKFQRHKKDIRGLERSWYHVLRRSGESEAKGRWLNTECCVKLVRLCPVESAHLLYKDETISGNSLYLPKTFWAEVMLNKCLVNEDMFGYKKLLLVKSWWNYKKYELAVCIKKNIAVNLNQRCLFPKKSFVNLILFLTG